MKDELISVKIGCIYRIVKFPFLNYIIVGIFIVKSLKLNSVLYGRIGYDVVILWNIDTLIPKVRNSLRRVYLHSLSLFQPFFRSSIFEYISTKFVPCQIDVIFRDINVIIFFDSLSCFSIADRLVSHSFERIISKFYCQICILYLFVYSHYRNAIKSYFRKFSIVVSDCLFIHTNQVFLLHILNSSFYVCRLPLF